MRYPRGHKRRSRERIRAEARRALRAAGLAGVGVERVMAGAGLTVGGFYAHFRSRRALVEETLADAMAEGHRRWLKGIAGPTPEAAELALRARYLTLEHLDAAGSGCPMPASISDLARAPATTRRTFARSLATYVAELAPHLPGATAAARRDAALRLLATCLGAMALARAVGDRELAESILRACREAGEAGEGGEAGEAGEDGEAGEAGEEGNEGKRRRKRRSPA